MRTIIAALFLGWMLAAIGLPQARAEVLITVQEARLASTPVVVATRGLTRGPGIDQESPAPDQSVRSPFSFKVRFAIRNNVEIDPSSVTLTYIKASPIDLTARIKTHLRPDGIVMDQAEAPPGVHLLRIDLKDMQGRAGTATLKLTVADR